MNKEISNFSNFKVDAGGILKLIKTGQFKPASLQPLAKYSEYLAQKDIQRQIAENFINGDGTKMTALKGVFEVIKDCHKLLYGKQLEENSQPAEKENFLAFSDFSEDIIGAIRSIKKDTTNRSLIDFIDEMLPRNIFTGPAKALNKLVKASDLIIKKALKTSGEVLLDSTLNQDINSLLERIELISEDQNFNELVRYIRNPTLYSGNPMLLLSKLESFMRSFDTLAESHDSLREAVAKINEFFIKLTGSFELSSMHSKLFGDMSLVSR